MARMITKLFFLDFLAIFFLISEFLIKFSGSLLDFLGNSLIKEQSNKEELNFSVFGFSGLKFEILGFKMFWVTVEIN